RPRMPVRRERCRLLQLSLALAASSLLRCPSTSDSSARSFHDLLYFIECGHGGVAGSGHGEGAMRCAALDGPLRAFACEESVDQAGSKGVAAADTIENLEVFAIGSLIEIAVAVADGAPIVS